MGLSPADMDRIIDEHFGYEARDDVDGVMASLAPSVEHEVVPSPVGALHDPAAIRAYYTRLFGAVRGRASRRSAASTATASWSTRRCGTAASKTARSSSATGRAAR